jgi:hypothetical protein
MKSVDSISSTPIGQEVLNALVEDITGKKELRVIQSAPQGDSLNTISRPVLRGQRLTTVKDNGWTKQ